MASASHSIWPGLWSTQPTRVLPPPPLGYIGSAPVRELRKLVESRLLPHQTYATKNHPHPFSHRPLQSFTLNPPSFEDVQPHRSLPNFPCVISVTPSRLARPPMPRVLDAIQPLDGPATTTNHAEYLQTPAADTTYLGTTYPAHSICTYIVVCTWELPNIEYSTYIFHPCTTHAQTTTNPPHLTSPQEPTLLRYLYPPTHMMTPSLHPAPPPPTYILEFQHKRGNVER